MDLTNQQLLRGIKFHYKIPEYCGTKTILFGLKPLNKYSCAGNKKLLFFCISVSETTVMNSA